jgi:ATP-dependent RNA helicase TDRD9
MNNNLPIYSKAKELFSSLDQRRVVIIQGGTGCGKTTQVPQLIFDQHSLINKFCNIICTQPRRLAAISVCNRVCKERRWKVGTLCGYHIGRERVTSDETRITYVTTGILIEKIISDKNALDCYTHVILDEVHDRDIDTDLALLLTKLSLTNTYSGKVILMSATINPNVFIDYFSDIQTTTHKSSSTQPCVIKCLTKSFDVKEYFLEDAIALCDDMEDFETNTKVPEFSDAVVDLIPHIIRSIDKKESNQAEKGSILIFAPGIEEIGRVDNILRKKYEKYQSIICIVLHSETSIKLQMQIYDKPKPGDRKVIISTNIAESSITISDVEYVIDFCLTKSLFCDNITSFSQLKLEWAAMSNLNQRKGRAGRVSNGICYHLIPKAFYDKKIRENPNPAILRAPLENLILKAKRFSEDNPRKLLSLLLTPPKERHINRTIMKLKESGALTLYKNGQFCSDDGDLTYAGSIMADLPIDVKLAKFILFGHVFGRLRSAIIIASALSLKNIFSKFFRSQIESYKNKFIYSDGLFCDFTCILNVYILWETQKINKTFNKEEQLNNWAESHGLESGRLKEMERLISDITNRLWDHNIKITDFPNTNKIEKGDDILIEDTYLIKVICF